MAKIEHYIPFCIKHEASVSLKKPNETNEEYFERARKRGYVKDSGGDTLTGLTLNTYRRYKPNATVEQLKNVSYSDWFYCMKRFFWDKIKADEINNQSVAEAIIDWFWNSGVDGIKPVQRLLKVTPDGIVGPKTINAINSQDPYELWAHIQSARYSFWEGLVKKNPTKYKKYFNGWVNRLNELKYED